MTFGWTQAQAQTHAQSQMTGFMIGAEGVYTSSSFDNDDFPGVSVTDEKKNVAGYRIFAGYQFTPSISLELAYFGTDNFRQSGTYLGLVPYELSAKVQGWELAPVFKLTEGVPGLFFKAGATYTTVELTATVPGVLSASDDTRGTGYLVGVGYEYSFTSNFAGRIAYTRYERLGGESGNKLNFWAAGVKFNF